MRKALVSMAILLAGCGRQPITPTPTPTVTPAPTPTGSARTEEYLDVFETVWQTVNDTYFDPDFGGVDWRAEHDRTQPLIAEADNDQAFYQLLNQMLWKLNVSHTGVGPAAGWSSTEPVVAAEGTTGLDVRLLDGEAVITRVEPGSSGEKVGLRPGFVLESIDEISIEQIIANTQLGPPYNDRGRIEGLTRDILGRIYGTPDTCVTAVYLDERSQQHETCITRIRRERPAVMEGLALPPSFLEFEARRLEQDIGYIRFNTFHPDLIPDMQSAIRSMQHAPGIIVDLRGNPGGNPLAAEAFAARFLTERASLGTFKTREGALDRIVEPAPAEEKYEGPVLILIDTLSYSASEYLAAAMQAIGRAVIIGQQSPGGVTGANVAALPNGAILIYPVLQIIAPDGTVLEGQGVIPDIKVELDRELLLQGIDSQLEAAIDYIEDQGTKSPVTLRPGQARRSCLWQACIPAQRVLQSRRIDPII
jgi:carboxyl-terminal processing protease